MRLTESRVRRRIAATGGRRARRRRSRGAVGHGEAVLARPGPDLGGGRSRRAAWQNEEFTYAIDPSNVAVTLAQHTDAPGTPTAVAPGLLSLPDNLYDDGKYCTVRINTLQQ